MAGEQVSGRQLSIVPCVDGGDGQDVILHVRQQVVGFKERQKKWVEPEKMEHRQVDQDMTILTVIQELVLNLEHIRVVLDQKISPGLITLIFKLFEKGCHIRGVQVIYSKSLVHCSLDGVGDLAEAVTELVLDPAQAGIKEHGICHNCVENELLSSTATPPSSSMLMPSTPHFSLTPSTLGTKTTSITVKLQLNPINYNSYAISKNFSNSCHHRINQSQLTR